MQITMRHNTLSVGMGEPGELTYWKSLFRLWFEWFLNARRSQRLGQFFPTFVQQIRAECSLSSEQEVEEGYEYSGRPPGLVPGS